MSASGGLPQSPSPSSQLTASSVAMRRLRVLVLMHPDHVPPDDAADRDEEERSPGRPNATCADAARDRARRPRVRRTGRVPARSAMRVEEFKPHVVFNLLEEFHGNVLFDQQRREPARAAARAVHRMQSARPDLSRAARRSRRSCSLPSHSAFPTFHVFPLGTSHAALRSSSSFR